MRRHKIPWRNEAGRQVLTLSHEVEATRRLEVAPQSGQLQGEQSGSQPKGEEEEAEEQASLENAAGTDAEEGLVRQKWRLISAVMANPTNPWGLSLLVDYSADGGKVIKSAVGTVNRDKPDLMKDHSSSIEAVIGHVENSKWENSGDIPPGVNGELVVDSELFPLEAKRLEKGGIYRSGSIGITAEMKKSHEDMDDWDFIEKQGRKIDGEIVRLIPTKLISVDHMAIIPAGRGADKNAGVRNQEESLTVAQQHHAGGIHMKKWLLDLMNKVSDLFKLNMQLDPNEDEAPEGFEEKLIGRLTVASKAYAERATLTARLEKIAKDGGLLNEGEDAITLEEILNRLPDRLELAKAGDAFLVHLREETLKVFDAAEVDPEKPELTDLQKKLRGRIEASDSIEDLQLWHEQYTALRTARFGLNRSSEAEELPDGKKKAAVPDTGAAADIREGVGKLFPRKGGSK